MLLWWLSKGCSSVPNNLSVVISTEGNTLFPCTFSPPLQCQVDSHRKACTRLSSLRSNRIWCADASEQPADHSEMDHATRSAFANVIEAETAPVGPDSRAVQELSSSGPGDSLPSGIDSPDRKAPNIQSSAETAPDSSSAVYHAASLTNDASEAETVPAEEQGPVTAEEDVQMQPGAFATEDAYLSFMQMHVGINHNPESDSHEHM